MELKEAILNRRSIRGYLPDPVSKETITQILEIATRAVSAQNGQPWEFAIVTGEMMKAMALKNVEDLEADVEPDFPDPPLEGVALDRARVIGKQLYGAMGIERGDKERRHWWLQRGFRFFDAPVVILLLMDKKWDAAYRFDMGCVAQNICLTALDMGLGTCVEAQAVTFQRSIREHLDLPESKNVVYGIALGYPDPEFPANAVVTPREKVEDITTWYGF